MTVFQVFLLFILAASFLLIIGVFLKYDKKKHNRSWPVFNNSQTHKFLKRSLENNANKKRMTQLEIVNENDYRSVKSIINNEERNVFFALNDVIDHNHYYLFVEVSMGEVIKPYKRYGGYVTNNKRFDFLITDKSFKPVLVVEYNGTGHYQKNWKERGLVKEIACQKAEC